MTEADSATRAVYDRYRQMASRIRALIPSLKEPQAIADLRLLADRYERFAEHYEATTAPSPAAAAMPSARASAER